ncbi:MAG: hypothetical protein RIQ60_2849 [Pseudomonadota bacterium]|jgi:hypothetical protein
MEPFRLAVVAGLPRRPVAPKGNRQRSLPHRKTQYSTAPGCDALAECLLRHHVSFAQRVRPVSHHDISDTGRSETRGRNRYIHHFRPIRP